MSLFWRIFLLNATVLLAAVALLLLGPVTVSTPVLLTETLILAVGLVVMLTANAALLRIGLSPLQRLTRAMTTTDLLRPGERPATSGHGDVAALIETYNAMLDRLEAERAASTARALSAQEAERRRVAQELHDEVGQTLTAVLLELKGAADQAGPPLQDDLHRIQETTRAGLDEIRRIARRLRPGVLEELGLVSALRSLANEYTDWADTVVDSRLAPHLPSLGDEAELVVYRVAQEGLTNVVRHAGASRADLVVSAADDRVTLLIRDNGRGIGSRAEGAGIRGMRERALLVGADLTVAPAEGGGTLVRLDVPVTAPGRGR
ncbi:histidine kinase [Streptomyces sp. YJ-C3]